MEIKHLFFDLDRTLWDFETNSFNELISLYHCHNLHQKGISIAEEFIKVYKKINQKCWERYRLNQLSKENLRFERFKETLEYFGIYNMLGKFAALIGPLLVGLITYVTYDSRLGMLSIGLFFIAGIMLFNISRTAK